MNGVLGLNDAGRLVVEGMELADGDEVEVWQRGNWLRGRVVYCRWRYAHRLALAGGFFVDLRMGMQARRVTKEGME